MKFPNCISKVGGIINRKKSCTLACQFEYFFLNKLAKKEDLVYTLIYLKRMLMLFIILL